ALLWTPDLRARSARWRRLLVPGAENRATVLESAATGARSTSQPHRATPSLLPHGDLVPARFGLALWACRSPSQSESLDVVERLARRRPSASVPGSARNSIPQSSGR